MLTCRLSGFEVHVKADASTESYDDSTRCGDQYSVAQGKSLQVQCGKTGRYVHVRLAEKLRGKNLRKQILTLCEVKVECTSWETHALLQL